MVLCATCVSPTVSVAEFSSFVSLVILVLTCIIIILYVANVCIFTKNNNNLIFVQNNIISDAMIKDNKMRISVSYILVTSYIWSFGEMNFTNVKVS